MSKRSKKSKQSRPTALIALVLILIGTNAITLYYFMFVQDVVPAEDVPMGIPDMVGNYDAYIGKSLTLLGYYVFAAGNHLLVSNPLFYFNNSLALDNHVILTGQVPQTIAGSIGRQIAVKGTVQEETSPTDLGSGVFSVESFFDVSVEIPFYGSYIDEQLDPYLQFDDIPFVIDTTPEKYAVLYSGGINSNKAYYRYWNDIIYMYFILQMHGYPSENIYVIYKDGVGEDTYTPVHYPATHTSLDTVFAELSDEMGRLDTLFFYTTNHGGSGGISVWNPMDSAGALTHAEVSAWLDSITCHHMIIVMEQCVSGKFISHLSASNRIIMTACKDDESSWACDDEGNWDEFVYHFMCALVSIAWNGDDVTVDADFDNDGDISMKEAFVWAAAMDSRDETPWYNDNGDGIGYNVVQVVFGLGSTLGDIIFL
ncbi:MAG: C13 family peptidase [Candidatus Hodarchaeota archaeon]